MRFLALTGKRGGFGAMVPFLRALEASSDYRGKKNELIIGATDQHLDVKFGRTIDEVKSVFSNVVEIPFSIGERSSGVLGFGQNLIRTIHELRPEVVIIYGDRSEALVCATVCSMMSIHIIHVQGGDKSGCIDEHARHAITKLSHIHFVSCSDSRRRVLQLGEHENSVFEVGDFHVDSLLGSIRTDFCLEEINTRLKSRPLVFLFHPDTGMATQEFICEAMKNSVDVANARYPSSPQVFIYPCSDSGFERIVSWIEDYAASAQRSSRLVLVYKNLAFGVFANLLSQCIMLVGNSSAGIIETPSLGVPSINIGNRQRGRWRSKLTFDADMDRDSIGNAMVLAAKHDRYEVDPLYGRGNAGPQAVSIINQIRWSEMPKIKQFRDMQV
jgi:UDP-hydrolysing UDP-N-acetyl-D-glucosamine 2-epimerase